MPPLRVSVAMATYNGEQYLREQLDSIGRQTLLPYELVISDDGSSDRTLEIVRAFGKSASFEVRISCNEERLGFADNFLKAATLCTGNLVAFCDQDDVWLEEKLARCEKPFSDGSVALVCHSGLAVDEKLEPLGWRCPDIKRDRVLPLLSLGPWQFYHGFAIVFRRSLLDHCPGSRPRTSAELLRVNDLMIHDQWISILATVFGRIAQIKDPLILYRRHAASVTAAEAPPRKRSWAERLIRCDAAAQTKQARDAAYLGEFLAEEVIHDSGPVYYKLREASRHYHALSRHFLKRARLCALVRKHAEFLVSTGVFSGPATP